MDISIIIVNYNTPELVVDCIQSITENTKDIEFEIIVVDNHSSPSDETIIKNQCPDVKYIYLENNFGFGFANNRGSEIANGDYLFFLNSDTIIIDNSIFELYSYLCQQPNIGVCGGNLFDKDMKPTSSCTRLFPGLKYQLSLLTGNIFLKFKYGKNLSFNYSDEAIMVARVSGADMMIKSSLFNEIGRFDEDYFMYSEETDLMYRLGVAGYPSVCINKSKIIHLEGQSCKFEMKKTKWGLISRDRFLHKRYPHIVVEICNVLHFLAALLLCARAVINKDKAMQEQWSFVMNNLFKITQYDLYL